MWCECDQWVEDYKCYLWTNINDPDTIGNNLFFSTKELKPVVMLMIDLEYVHVF